MTSRSDVFRAKTIKDLFSLLCEHLGRQPTASEFRSWVNTAFGPYHISGESFSYYAKSHKDS